VLDEVVQERYQLAFGKSENGERGGLRQMTVVRGLARNLIEVQGIFLDTAKLRLPGNCGECEYLEWISDLMDWKSKKLRYKGGRQIPNGSLKEENEHVR
jgi:hypothetical protein